MTRDEAKYILLACRHPDAAEADARAAEALAMLESDPELTEWFAREAALDTALAEGLEAIEPPAGLKEKILAAAPRAKATAGGDTSIPFPASELLPWWRNPRLISMAAGLVLLLSFTFLLLDPQDLSADDDVPEFYREVARHMGSGADLQVRHDDLGYLSDFLRTQGAPAPGYLPGRVDPLDEVGALIHVWREAPVGVVHMRNHADYQLYVIEHVVFSKPSALPSQPQVKEVDGVGIMVWVDGNHLHVLATKAGAGALLELL